MLGHLLLSTMEILFVLHSGCRGGNDKLLDRNQCEHALELCWQKLKRETLSEPLLKVAVWVNIIMRC